MTDRKISAGCAVACGLWVVMAALMIASWIYSSDELRGLALATAAAAATASIRQYHVVTNSMLMNAFELGRDSVRPLR